MDQYKNTQVKKNPTTNFKIVPLRKNTTDLFFSPSFKKPQNNLQFEKYKKLFC